MKSSERAPIALFGGSFNPCHLGHLHIAAEYHARFPKTRIFLTPCFEPPHKLMEKCISDEDRLALVKILFQSISYVYINTFEISRPGISYTIETIQEILRDNPQTEKIHVIIGDDLLPEIHTWKDFKGLCNTVKFICFTRSGCSGTYELPKNVMVEAHKLDIEYFEIPINPASSSRIRTLLRGRTKPEEPHVTQELHTMLSAAQIEYIYRNKLYIP